MISIRDVSCRVGDLTLLAKISLELTGRRVAVLGCNGSGKSTFARLLNGLILPDTGSVHIGALDTRNDSRKIRQKVGFVFQNPDIQFVFPTVEEDLLFGLKNMGLSKSEQLVRLETVLDFYGLSKLRHRSVHHLSGGEKQLLCIAGVVVMRPELVVFDEPTTLLDLRNRRLINRTILNLDANVVVVTHDLEFARDFEEAVLIDSGSVVCSGVPSVVVERYLALVSSDSESVFDPSNERQLIKGSSNDGFQAKPGT